MLIGVTSDGTSNMIVRLKGWQNRLQADCKEASSLTPTEPFYRFQCGLRFINLVNGAAIEALEYPHQVL